MKPTTKVQVTDARQSEANGDGAGTDERFEAELAALRPALFLRAKTLTKSAAAADDLVQDTMVRALRKRQAFRSGTNLRAWTYAILYNLFVDASRRPSGCELVEDVIGAEEPPFEPPTPIDLVLMDDVLEAIAASPGHFKDILHLAYVERLTGREISVRLGLTLRTVSMRLFRGRRSLRGQLERVFRHRSGAFRRCGRSGGGAPPCAAVET